MKTFVTLIVSFWASLSYADEFPGKVCLHIPERGAEMVVIQNACQKGDIIQLNKRSVAYLCDFDKAIISYGGADQYVCSYLGVKRDLREGTNP
jgi:hypothetical protein